VDLGKRGANFDDLANQQRCTPDGAPATAGSGQKEERRITDPCHGHDTSLTAGSNVDSLPLTGARPTSADHCWCHSLSKLPSANGLRSTQLTTLQLFPNAERKRIDAEWIKWRNAVNRKVQLRPMIDSSMFALEQWNQAIRSAEQSRQYWIIRLACTDSTGRCELLVEPTRPSVLDERVIRGPAGH
jgi:hypothetical protein